MLREPPVGTASTPRTSVAISFGSPASESGVTRLDLNDILIRHPQAAFLMRIAGDSMREAGVEEGDAGFLPAARAQRGGEVGAHALRPEVLDRHEHQAGIGEVVVGQNRGCSAWRVPLRRRLLDEGAHPHPTGADGAAPSRRSSYGRKPMLKFAAVQ